MLVLPALHTYLSQLLSPPFIHTALLFTPSGALVSYASQTSTGESSCGSSLASSNGSASSGTPQGSKRESVASVETRTRTKDEVRMAAGLGAEVWAETRGEGEGMVESELGRVLVLAVEDERAREDDAAPLLLLAVNGTLEADWDAMRLKARKLATFLAPSVNRHRGMMDTATSSLNGSKSRTRSTATSPGRGTR